MEQVQRRHFWFRARAEILLDLLTPLAEDGRRVLDVGCGTGLLLASLPAGSRLAGLDSSERALSHARRRLGESADLRSGSLPAQIPFEENSQDLITLTDVLEHIEDDRATLVELRRRLAPGGRLLLTVPAFSFLWSRHDEEHGHFRRYRAPALRRLLEDSGFRVERLGYFNFLLFPMVLAVRALKKITGDRGGDMEIPGAPLNALLYTIFRSERIWLRRGSFPWGVSLLAVARREEDTCS